MRLRPWMPPVALGVVAAAATAYTGIADPNSNDPFPLCPLKAATGWDCPACGSLRAVHSLCRLDVAGAMDHNLLFTLTVPFIVIGYALWLAKTLGIRVPSVQVPRPVVISLFGVALAFAVIRNLPIPGHAFLGSGIG